MSTERPHDEPRELFVVGIGASAGGLEALELFFHHVDDSPEVAYVVIQHLSPEHPSLMDELLVRHTRLPIQVVTQATKVHPNHIYLNPPGKEMIIANGELILADRAERDGLTLPIDHFFRSLSQDLGTHAVAIVLSGTGSDGSRGIREVHDAGGLVLAQSEESARFDGMPRAAQETGIVDAVLSPDEMPDMIASYVAFPTSGNRGVTPRDVLPSLEANMSTIFRLLRCKYGIDFSNYKASTITRRVERRLMLNHSFDLSEYAESLNGNDEELNRLYKDLLIGVTRFFRDDDAFAYLEHTVVPSLIGRANADEGLRIWIAGTATGEEAYSIGMILAEQLERRAASLTAKIFATDVHVDSLEVAARGMYSEDDVKDVSPARLERFFVRRPDGYLVAPALRKMVVFAPHNVIRDAPFTSLDMITCRNMLIYLRPHSQKKALSMFHFGLKPGGVLWLGPSESAGELVSEFEAMNDRWRFFQKSRDVRIALTSRYPSKTLQSRTPTNEPTPVGVPSHLLETYDKLLNDYMPPSVLVTESHALSHVFAGASQFLQHRDGRPTSDVVDIVLPELRTPLLMALQRATKERAPVVFSGIRVETRPNEEIKLIVKPFYNRTANRLDSLVVFESRADVGENAVSKSIDIDGATAEQVSALESELRFTKQSLQATIQELETTNEELQATNEELIASNEELQSTNEELHSVNEELYTVNSEYQRKIAELTEVTDDMDNLLNSTNVDTVFLDRELKIRKFTPGIAKTINLIPQDIGRRIDSFTHTIQDVKVLELLETVLETGQSLETDVRDTRGRWYLLRVLPYVSKKSIDGVVLTLIDINSLKEAEANLTELSEIVEQSADAILRIDLDGTIRTWNRGATTLLGYSHRQAVGRQLDMLIPSAAENHVAQLLRRVALGESVSSHQMEWRDLHGKTVDVSLNVSPIRNAAQSIIGASAIARDISEVKRAEQEIRLAVRRRDQFLAMLSHELRNPLAAILNATTLLKEESLDDVSYNEARDVVEHQLHHVARLLDDLLDVARITNDKLVLHPEVVDLSKLVMDVVDCVQHLIEDAEQHLHMECPDERLFVDGDVGRLQQAQVNLLVNASKYSPRNSTIRYSLSRVDGHAEITVTDAGEGIPPEIAEQIFEPFVQAEQTLDRAQGGMGLGLTLVRMIADAHGGSVSVSSDGQGRGSRFAIRLPLTTSRPTVHRIDPTMIPHNTRLLLIEDNDGIRKMLARALELKGFHVMTACDGREGLSAFAEFQPHVTIVDIGLPDIDGYALAKKVREDDSSALLIAVTGYGRKDDEQKAFDAGFDLHLVKPIHPAELISKISPQLGHPNQNSANTAENAKL
ncbi:MAG: chemotaxis protein CheB [Pirellulaceae bacterium]